MVYILCLVLVTVVLLLQLQLSEQMSNLLNDYENDTLIKRNVKFSGCILKRQNANVWNCRHETN